MVRNSAKDDPKIFYSSCRWTDAGYCCLGAGLRLCGGGASIFLFLADPAAVIEIPRFT
jgi:hypothetical protein